MVMGISGSIPEAFVLQNEAQSLWFGTSANERMRIDAAGNVAINTFSPAARLDVSGTVKLGAFGSVLNGILKNTVSINIPLLAAGAETTQTVTFFNAAVGASVYVSPAAALTGIVIAYARVSSAGNVEIKFVNTSAAAVDPAAMNFFITVIQ
jgi:trimeric autotransporter adhesin